MRTLQSLVSGRRLFSVSKEWTVFDVAQYMAEKRIGAVPVVDGKKIVGIFSERDLMTRVVVPGLNPSMTPIADVMTHQVASCEPGETHVDGMRLMQQASCRHLPVVDQGHLVGFLSLRDLLQVEIDEKEDELRHINNYVHSAGY